MTEQHEKTEEIIRMYREGATIDTIRAELHAHYRTVKKCLDDAGLHKKRYMTTEQRQWIIDLGREGLTSQEISDRTGRTKLAVQRVLKKHDLNEYRTRPIEIDGDVAYVTLTKGVISTISASDVEKVSGRNWSLTANGKYAAGWDGEKNVVLHRFIMDEPDGLYVDHINHDGLDNRRENLRIVTSSENGYNARRSGNNPYPRGVAKNVHGNKFYATLSLPGFDTPEEASEAWEKGMAALKAAGLIAHVYEDLVRTDKKMEA